MKAIILIELDEEHLIQQTNDLYDRLKGYKCKLKDFRYKVGAMESVINPDGYTLSTAAELLEEIEND